MTECQYGCGKELIWDKNRRSDSGKMIPIEKATNEPHNCPKSPYNMGKSGQAQASAPTPAAPQQSTMEGADQTLSLAERIGVLESQLGQVRTDIVDLIARLNKLDGGSSQ